MTFVNFNDETKEEINAVFGCSQPDEDMWPFQDEVEDNDPRLVEFLNPSWLLPQ